MLFKIPAADVLSDRAKSLEIRQASSFKFLSIYQFFSTLLIFFVFFLYWSFSSIIVKLSWLLFLYLKYIFNVNLLGSGWVLGPFEEWLSQHACHPLSFLKEVTRIYQRTSPTIVKYVFKVARMHFSALRAEHYGLPEIVGRLQSLSFV